MNPCQPPNCPCFCPTADLPIAPIVVAQGGPAVAVTLPIYGTQPFQVSITVNPTLPVAGVPIIASAQLFNGNVLTITTAIPDILETLGIYVATIQVCNACGTFTTQVQIEVAADLNPVLTNCVLAQALWTPEARVPTVGDTLLAFTPAGCRSLLPPLDVCTVIQGFPAVVPTLATELATADCGLATVADVLALYPLCANLQAFPVGAPLVLGDRLIALQAANCVTATVADVVAAVQNAIDVCVLLQNLPNAVVQPTAVFYGQQAGACFEFAVADLLALAVPACPLLASCDGSCVAPAYSFASSPSSGVWFDPTIGPAGAVVISDNNCANRINVGASVSLSSAPGSAITLTAGAGIGGNVVVGTDNVILSLFQNGTAFLNTASGSSFTIDPTGSITLFTAGVSFSITAAGEFTLNGNPGTAGQVITSNGAAADPTWQNVSPSFPLLAPNGSCLAPSYSFTASPDSGMFYTGTAVRISDDNCIDFIDVGASITASTSTNLSLQAFSGNVTIFASNSVGTVFINGANSTYTGTVTTNLTCTALNGGSLNIGTSSTSMNAAPINITGGTTTLGVGATIDIAAGGATSGTAGSLRLRAGAAGVGVHGTLSIETGAVTRLTFGGAGGWNIGGSEGVVGQVIKSNGAGTPPTWQNDSATFPLLAPDGSCAAPSYSFTTSPDSGMFYDPAGVGSVVIGDDNCADFIAIGASITVQTTASDISLFANGGISSINIRAGDTVRLFTPDSANGVTADMIVQQPVGNAGGTLLLRGGDATLPINGQGGGVTIMTGAGDQNGGDFQFTAGSTPGAQGGGFIFDTGSSPSNAGSFRIRIGGVDNFAINGGSNSGSWNIGGSNGTAGQVITSNGASSPPSWQSGITIPVDNALLFTNQTDGAGASVGTLTNAPSAGDPAFWLRVVINGVNRFIPCWA